MNKEGTRDKIFAELATLFFTTRQIIRSQVPGGGKADPNAWLRCETIRYIAEVKNPTMHDIASYLRVKAPSATSLIDNLEKAGLIERVSGTKDKRVVRIFLTNRGKKEVARYQRRAAKMMQGTFSKLSAKEIIDLIAIFRRVRDVHSQ